MKRKLIIVGGGIIGALEAYYAHLEAVKSGRNVHITIYEKGSSFEHNALTNTAYHIFPSLTPDEILAVVPRGSKLMEGLSLLFSQPGGIRVDDVPGIHDSIAAMRFKEAAALYGSDENHDDRTDHLLWLGKMGMELWQRLYEEGDEELKAILDVSNYHPCRHPTTKDKKVLHDGYRIDLIYDHQGAHHLAQEMQATYEKLGYDGCMILSPDEVIGIDPFLRDFCNDHCEVNGQWKSDCSALWRPGGCISTSIFLPKFYAYLKKIMGAYFHVEFNTEVVAVELKDDMIACLKFSSSTLNLDGDTFCLFCPGESVGTLSRLGFDEPAFAGFAGPSLTLDIPLSSAEKDRYKHFSHYMEVHKVGICLAWQARYKNDKIILGVAGTKAFYGDQLPTIDQEFAKNRHLLHLNTINEVLPEVISLACGFATTGVALKVDIIPFLEDQGILKRWVGRRAVAYDGFPTLGPLYRKGLKVSNGRCTTHLGSGGVSVAPAAVHISRHCEQEQDAFAKKILHYASSMRCIRL
jgi:hypothetical protein